jgi:hypothetical protein
MGLFDFTDEIPKHKETNLERFGWDHNKPQPDKHNSLSPHPTVQTKANLQSKSFVYPDQYDQMNDFVNTLNFAVQIHINGMKHTAKVIWYERSEVIL